MNCFPLQWKEAGKAAAADAMCTPVSTHWLDSSARKEKRQTCA